MGLAAKRDESTPRWFLPVLGDAGCVWGLRLWVSASSSYPRLSWLTYTYRGEGKEGGDERVLEKSGHCVQGGPNRVMVPFIIKHIYTYTCQPNYTEYIYICIYIYSRRIYAYRFAKDQQTRRDARPIRAAVPAAVAAARLDSGSLQQLRPKHWALRRKVAGNSVWEQLCRRTHIHTHIYINKWTRTKRSNVKEKKKVRSFIMGLVTPAPNLDVSRVLTVLYGGQW